MSTATGIAALSGKRSVLVARIRAARLHSPEWWVLLLSICAWGLFLLQPFAGSGEGRAGGSVIYCMTSGTDVAAGNILKEAATISRIGATVSNGLLPWIVMVAAMMFPLLKEPIRHVAFSVRRKDRDLGIFWFLAGYTLTWTLAGVLFLLLPLLLNEVTGGRPALVNVFITSSGFLLAAALTWLPARPRLMTGCGQTMPIRIAGWKLDADCVAYGSRMGFACLRMCVAPMAALMIAHHSVALMFAVTLVLLCERYRLPHTSRFPGYAWAGIALVLFMTGILA